VDLFLCVLDMEMMERLRSPNWMSFVYREIFSALRFRMEIIST
jgi:hypothetical protein